MTSISRKSALRIRSNALTSPPMSELKNFCSTACGLNLSCICFPSCPLLVPFGQLCCLLDSVGHMSQGTGIDHQQTTFSALEQLSVNGDGFCNKLAQSIVTEGVPFLVDQQKLVAAVARNENRWNASTQAARCTVAVNLPLPRVHHSEVALAVYNLAGDGHSAQVASQLLIRGRGIQHCEGTGCYLHHCPALAINQLALHADLLAIEASHEVVRPMFSWCNQKVPRVFRLLPGHPRTLDQQRGIRRSGNRPFKAAHLSVFEYRVRERLLSNDQHQGNADCQHAKRTNHSSEKTGQTLWRLRQVAYVKVVHRDCASLRLPWEDSISAGWTWVPGGLGRGCTKTAPSTTLTWKVGTFSLNGGGAAPDSG